MTRFVRWTGLVVLALLAVVMATVAGVLSFFGLAHATESVPILTSGSAIVFLVVSSAGMWLAARLLAPKSSRFQTWLPTAGSVASLFLVGLLWAGLVHQPMEFEYAGMEATEETRFWELPTGSHVAFAVTPATEPSERPPVVWLHGGPGAPDRAGPAPDDSVLAEDGFDVYRYHQVGSGLSSRLEDVSEYTVERHVADLEAIRIEIGAERLILIGGSWGATLAAHYLAAHPERVERVIFAGPGAIWQPAWGASIEDISDGTETNAIADAVTPRFAIAYYLQRINPRAASNLVPDEELSAFFQSALSGIIAADIGQCRAGHAAPPAGVRAVVPAGFGFYANVVTSESQYRTPDPRPLLSGMDIPALVVRGECDRIRPEIAEEYVRLLDNAHLVKVEGAAHSVAGSPDFLPLVRRFLREDGPEARVQITHAQRRAGTPRP